MSLFQFLKVVAVGATWGGSHSMIRVTVPEIGPSISAFMRIFISGVFLSLLLRTRSKKLNFSAHGRHYFLAGFFNFALPQLFLAVGAVHLPAAYLSIINGTVPAFILMFSVWLLNEPLGLRKIFALVLGLGGVALLSQFGSIHEFSMAIVVALLVSLAAAASYGFGSVYVKRWAPHINPLELTAGGGFMGSLVLLPLVIYSWIGFVPPAVPQHSMQTVIFCLLGLGIFGSGFAFVIFYQLIQEIGAFRASMATFFMPLFGMLWGYLFLSEPVTAGMFGGAGLILVSTALCLYQPRRVKSGAKVSVA